LRNLTLTIFRSGVEREFEGKQADFLLTFSTGRGARSQLGYLSERASALLAELGGEEITREKDIDFRYNLVLLELDAKANDRKKRERIPKPIADALREHLLDETLTPQKVPGFIREMATFHGLPGPRRWERDVHRRGCKGNQKVSGKPQERRRS